MYPALTVLQALGSDAQPVLWVGGEGGMEADLVKRANIPFETVPAAGVHGVGLAHIPGNLWKLFRGWLASRRILRSFKPDVLLFTGGYVAVPMALAGIRYPSLLYVPDIEPGLALKVLARYSDTIALTAEESHTFFHYKKTVVTGYPTRPDLGNWDRKSGRKALNLDPDQKTLLVFGGSKGARSINQAILTVLPDLLKQMQVIHITGNLDWEMVKGETQALAPDISMNYHPYPYLHEEMGAAFAAADLAVSRAGASVLGELPRFGLPAILVPYPYAWRYQKVNADYLITKNAAVLLENEMLSAKLLPLILDLFQNSSRLAEMKQAMFSLAKPDAAQKIAEVLREMAASQKHSTGGAA